MIIIPLARSKSICALASSLGLAICVFLLFVDARARSAEIVDQRGHRVVLNAPAKHVVFLPMPGPAMYIAVDGTDRHIVAMNPASKAAAREGLLSVFFPKLNETATNIVQGASFMPNVETILALHPDAVFQWTNPGSGVIVPLENARLTVFGMRNGGQSDLRDAIILMGKVSGEDKRAQTIVEMQNKRADELAAALKGLPGDQRPRVLYLRRFSGSLSVNGSGSYNDFYIQLAGGDDVATSSLGVNGTVTLEQILAWNPQVILLGNFDKAMPDDLYNDPRWQGIAAVKTHRVYRMPLGGYRWDPPSEESALAWTWLAELLHPDRVRINLRRDVHAWYKILYGRTPTEADIDRILFVKQNEGSAGYIRLAAP